MTISEIREAAARLLEQGWTQGCTARGRRDNPVRATYRYATTFCMIGAIRRVVGDNDDLQDEVRLAVYRELGLPLSAFNDDPRRTQSEVVAAMRGRPPLPETSEHGEP